MRHVVPFDSEGLLRSVAGSGLLNTVFTFYPYLPTLEMKHR